MQGSSSKSSTLTLHDLYNSYKDKESDLIGPEGIERFCEDLNLHPSDRQVLLLAYVMKAQKMGYFSRQEFETGFETLHARTIAQLKKALPTLNKIATNQQKDFHDFAFRFCFTEPGQKIIDVETAAQMLPLVLPQGRFVKPFCEFLTHQQEYKKMTSDQWSNFLKFSQEVHADMSNAEDNPAWPVLLDNFVAWYRKGI